MNYALEEALIAKNEDEVPVGAIVVFQDEIIAKNHNRVEQNANPMHHAEVLVIEEAVKVLKEKWLSGCELYVTLEPCSMCAGAIVLSRIERVIFGTFDSKAGACGSLLDIPEHPLLNHKPTIVRGVLQDTCKVLLRDFFKEKR